MAMMQLDVSSRPQHATSMDGAPHLHAGLDSHTPFRAKTYSNSNSAEPTKHKHTKHRHHHDRHSSSRRHARDVVQSAIQLQPPASFGDLLKQARGSKDTSPSHSRKGSVHAGDGSESKEHDVGMTLPPRKPLRPEDVELERKRVEARERYAALRLTARHRPWRCETLTGQPETSALLCSRSRTSR